MNTSDVILLIRKRFKECRCESTREITITFPLNNYFLFIFVFCRGSPYPEQERNAADAVMQFAIHKLQFKPENIIVMGKYIK